jgi:hypothetical protein
MEKFVHFLRSPRRSQGGAIPPCSPRYTPRIAMVRGAPDRRRSCTYRSLPLPRQVEPRLFPTSYLLHRILTGPHQEMQKGMHPFGEPKCIPLYHHAYPYLNPFPTPRGFRLLSSRHHRLNSFGFRAYSVRYAVYCNTQPLSHAGDFDFCHHVIIVSKPLQRTKEQRPKRTFLRWRALPLSDGT